MKIVTISDTHNKHKQIDCGSGDMLIHAGDATGRGQFSEIEPFIQWLSKQDFKYKILIAGNHDWGFESEPDIYLQMCKKHGIIYLNDSGVTIEGIKIWGSPVQPEFCNWAFNRTIYEHDGRYQHIKQHWDLIPNDTDILITHGPPYGILDQLTNGSTEHVGCPHLIKAIKRVNPIFHIFGHIHEQHGVNTIGKTTFINASQLDDRYIVTYKPIKFELN